MRLLDIDQRQSHRVLSKRVRHPLERAWAALFALHALISAQKDQPDASVRRPLLVQRRRIDVAQRKADAHVRQPPHQRAIFMRKLSDFALRQRRSKQTRRGGVCAQSRQQSRERRIAAQGVQTDVEEHANFALLHAEARRQRDCAIEQRPGLEIFFGRPLSDHFKKPDLIVFSPENRLNVEKGLGDVGGGGL